jgi:hypothetical protein
MGEAGNRIARAAACGRAAYVMVMRRAMQRELRAKIASFERRCRAKPLARKQANLPDRRRNYKMTPP